MILIMLFLKVVFIMICIIFLIKVDLKLVSLLIQIIMSELNDSAVLLEQKDNFCSKTIKYVCPIISVIFTCGFLSYLVCSIAFLIGDFNKSSQYSNCYLW
mgnify:FL=1